MNVLPVMSYRYRSQIKTIHKPDDWVLGEDGAVTISYSGWDREDQNGRHDNKVQLGDMLKTVVKGKVPISQE